MSSTNETIDVKTLYEETVIGLMVVNPFFYHWLQQLRFTPSDRVKTAAVAYNAIGECGRMFINQDFFNRLTLPQRMFVLQHELMHWVYQHPMLPEGARRFFNIAADVYINTQLDANPHIQMPQGEDEGITWANLQSHVPSLDMSNPPANDVGTLAILEWLEQSIRREPPVKVAIAKPGKSNDTSDDEDEEKPDLIILVDGDEPEDEDDDQQDPAQNDDVPVIDLRKPKDDSDAEPETDQDRPEDLDAGGHDDDSQEQLRGGQGSDEPCLPEDADDQGSDQAGEGSGEEPPSQQEEAEKQLAALAAALAEDHELWHEYGDPQKAEAAMQRLAQDLEEAKNRTDPEDFNRGCGSFAGHLAGILEAARKPKVNWRRELRSFVGYCGAVTLRGTYGQFNKYHQLPKIKLLPGTRLVVLFDTSASVSDAEASAFLGEMEALARDGVEILWVEFDWVVQNVSKFRKGNSYRIHGRGGTSFEAAFEWVHENWNKERLTGVIVCSDGECSWPSQHLIPDPKRVLWVITNPRYTAPEEKGRTTHIKVERTSYR